MSEKKLMEYESRLYILVLNEMWMEWPNELVECEVLLPFIVKVNRNSYSWTKIEKWDFYPRADGVLKMNEMKYI